MKKGVLYDAFVVFVRRQGRLTPRQEQALEKQWPIFGIEYQPEPIDFSQVFGRNAPVVLEIGFGMGASLVTMAKIRQKIITLVLRYMPRCRCLPCQCTRREYLKSASYVS